MGGSAREEKRLAIVSRMRIELQRWASERVIHMMITHRQDACRYRDIENSTRRALINALFDGWERGIADYHASLLELHDESK